MEDFDFSNAPSPTELLTEDQMTHLRRLAKEFSKAEMEAEILKEQVAENARKIATYRDDLLPRFAKAAGFKGGTLTTDEGEDIEIDINDDIFGSLPKAAEDPVAHGIAVKWFNDSGEGDAVKRVLMISLDTGKDSEKEEARILDGVRKVAPKATIGVTTTVHPSTAKSRIKKRLEKGVLATETENATQVLQKLGFVRITRASIK